MFQKDVRSSGPIRAQCAVFRLFVLMKGQRSDAAGRRRGVAMPTNQHLNHKECHVSLGVGCSCCQQAMGQAVISSPMGCRPKMSLGVACWPMSLGLVLPRSPRPIISNSPIRSGLLRLAEGSTRVPDGRSGCGCGTRWEYPQWPGWPRTRTGFWTSCRCRAGRSGAEAIRLSEGAAAERSCGSVGSKAPARVELSSSRALQRMLQA